MAYPIQPTVVKNYLKFTLVTTGGSLNVTDYVTNFTASVGGEADNYFFAQVAGTASLELYDTETLIAGSWLLPGTHLELTDTATTVALAYYYVNSVVSGYALDPVSGDYVYTSQVELSDNYARAASVTVEDHKLFSGTAETQTLANLGTAVSTACGWVMGGIDVFQTGTYVNQFATGGNILEIISRAAKGSGAYATIPQEFSDTYYVKQIPTASAPATYFFTDGTHTSTPSGTTRYDYVGIEYGQNSDNALSSCTFNNYGLDRAPQSTSDKTVNDVIVPYTSTQSIGYTRAAEFDAAVATNNLGWNLIHEDGTGNLTPTTWATTTNTTWKITRPSQSVMSLNGHYVYRCKVIAAAGAPIGSGFLLDNPDPEYDFVTTFPGGSTPNNWIASAKIRVTTQRTLRLNINWYDANGNSTGTTTGTNTVINTGSWVTLSTQCSTANVPANSVTAVPVIVTNVAIGQYGYFFASEVLLTRTNVATAFFNGDTPDDASYCYTWTGEPYVSPSQKNTNNIKALTDAVLTRTTPTAKAQSIAMNFTNLLGVTQPFVKIAQAFGRANTSAGGAGYYNFICYVCLDGVNTKYMICGMNYRITPTTVEADLNLVKLI